MARPLKVYRTPIGFHDAYVAAPSQAAALRAWGTDRDLFARGAAELVTDPALSAAPLAAPGSVVKLLRGSAEEQMAATSTPSPRKSRPETKPRKIVPRPSRTALDKAERALQVEEASRTKAMDAISRQIAELEKRRHAIAATHDAKSSKLQAARDEAEAAYDAAIDKWRRDAS